MGKFVAGDVVVIPFPFTDFSAEKKRPALVIAERDFDDYILCQITSRPWHEPAVEIADADFEQGGLEKPSYARPDRVFTVHESVIDRRAGTISPEKLEEVRAVLRKILQ